MKIFGTLGSILIMVWLLFAASCVTRQVPTLETYSETEYRTEYRTESYTETVPTVTHANQGHTLLTPVVKWHTNVLPAGLTGLGGTYYYGYVLGGAQHSTNQVTVHVSLGALNQDGLVRVYDLSSIGQIPPKPTAMGMFGPDWEELNWLNTFNAVLSSAHVLGELNTRVATNGEIAFDAKSVTQFAILVTTWNTYPISSVEWTWTDDVVTNQTVTKERQVPYQVPYQVEKQRTVTKTETVPIWQGIFGQ
jgi:hypothetical protein